MIFTAFIVFGVCSKLLLARPIDQIEHVIIFMQENRPFDHYFGTLQGVRGFNDRTLVMLSTGRDAFFQPVDVNDETKYMLPYRTIANESNAMCMPAPEMYYPTDIKIWNGGRLDAWNTARDGGYGMAYFTREDLPYYYSLYDAFAVGDHYYQSTFTATNPNRMHLFSGSNGLSVGEPAVLENTEPRPGYNWSTIAEVLMTKNISWRVYQQYDNFDDNGFAWFASFQQSRPGDVLFDQGMARQVSLIDELRQDMQSNTLPQVSIIVAPTRKSEHATNHPCAGEDFTARILQVLQENPAVYAKSAFILNYDEGGQFYDHAWPPTPPLSSEEGFSSVTVEGEVNRDVLTEVPAPIGLGFRVPLLIVSPWTRGNIVVSEVFDHTSVLQFLEVWGNVTFETISPWRRLVTGDLTSAFDFDHPDYTWPSLPDTSSYVKDGDVECHTLPNPIIPTQQSFPKQENGTRTSRHLGYEVKVNDDVTDDTFILHLVNSGSIGVPLVLYDILFLKTELPRQYALQSDASFTLTEKRLLQGTATSEGIHYRYVLMGPNGFLREFHGNTQCSVVKSSLTYLTSSDEVLVEVSVSSSATSSIDLTVTDNAYESFSSQTVTLAPGTSQSFKISTATSSNWYDISVKSVKAVEDYPCYHRRFMGRMETGKDTSSDPAMASAKETWLGPRETDAQLVEVHASGDYLQYSWIQK